MVNQFLIKANKLCVNIDSIYHEKNGEIKKKIINNIKLHELRSCSKLLIAFAYGILLNRNVRCKFTDEILSINTKIFPTLSAVYNGAIPEQVKDWTIKTLLTHSTGYDKMMLNEKHLESVDKNNLLKVLFETKLKYKANEHFTYSNVEPFLLSVFFQENFGQNIADFINANIFKPLNILNFEWLSLGKYCTGATGLMLNHNDFHKLGQLLMNNGNYQGCQIIPESWIKLMISKQVDCPDYYKPERLLPKLGAGYFTWISRDDIVFRDGSNGQYIICDFKNRQLITIMSSQKDMSLITECLRSLI